MLSVMYANRRKEKIQILTDNWIICDNNGLDK